MRQRIASIVVVAVLLAAAAIVVWRWPRPIDASVFVGRGFCAVQIAATPIAEPLPCEQVVAYLKTRVPAGANIALGYARGPAAGRGESLDAALRAAGYRRTVTAAADPAGAPPP